MKIGWEPPSSIHLTAEEKAKKIRELVKPLRVCRNLVASYQRNTGESHLNRDIMTGYEIGRLTREGRKIADALETLLLSGETKFVLHVYNYMDLKNIQVWRFNKSGTSFWIALSNLRSQILEGLWAEYSLDPNEIVRMVEMIHDLLDTPLAQTPGKFILIKLSLK